MFGSYISYLQPAFIFPKKSKYTFSIFNERGLYTILVPLSNLRILTPFPFLWESEILELISTTFLNSKPLQNLFTISFLSLLSLSNKST